MRSSEFSLRLAFVLLSGAPLSCASLFDKVSDCGAGNIASCHDVLVACELGRSEADWDDGILSNDYLCLKAGEGLGGTDAKAEAARALKRACVDPSSSHCEAARRYVAQHAELGPLPPRARTQPRVTRHPANAFFRQASSSRSRSPIGRRASTRSPQ